MVALIERGILRGREQSGTFPQRARSFLELNLLCAEVLEQAIATTTTCPR